MKFKSVLLLSFAIAVFFGSCSKEEDSAFVTPNSGTTTSTNSNPSVVELLTLQDFMAEGTLTINTNPTLEPNAMNYGYQTYDWHYSPGFDPVELYVFDNSLPGSVNTLPPNSPLGGGWTGTLYKIRGSGELTCNGDSKNCREEVNDDGSTTIKRRFLARAIPIGGGNPH